MVIEIVSGRPGPGAAQRGAVALEVALLMLLFLTMFFVVIETGRAVYLWNSVHEITRAAARGAAVTDFSNAAALDRLRQRAIFRDSPGGLLLGGVIDDSYVRIDYLWLSRGAGAGASHTLMAGATPPACPLRNLINCTANPYAASCVRFVRARFCQPGGTASDCAPVPYTPMAGLLDGFFKAGGAAITLPIATTVQPAESLGYLPGAADCP